MLLAGVRTMTSQKFSYIYLVYIYVNASNYKLDYKIEVNITEKGIYQRKDVTSDLKYAFQHES